VARNALGKGLGALIRDVEVETPQAAPAVATTATAPAAPALAVAGGPLLLDIDLLDPSPYQPRTRFSEAALEELAQSIRSSGIIQPLVVRKIGARYQLIAGERRWRAAQRAQLLRVPVILREVGDEQALELTLVENIQREDLNPIEQARAFQRLMDQFHLTQDEVATRTGKDRATVANSVRLLMLNETFLEWIEEGKITAGHGRALLGAPDAKTIEALAEKASRAGLSVREIERLVRSKKKEKDPSQGDGKKSPSVRDLEERLARKLGTRVEVQDHGGKGEIAIRYSSLDELDRLLDFILK